MVSINNQLSHHTHSCTVCGQHQQSTLSNYTQLYHMWSASTINSLTTHITVPSVVSTNNQLSLTTHSCTICGQHQLSTLSPHTQQYHLWSASTINSNHTHTAVPSVVNVNNQHCPTTHTAVPSVVSTSPWHNCIGWMVVKIQVTYYLVNDLLLGQQSTLSDNIHHLWSPSTIITLHV